MAYALNAFLLAATITGGALWMREPKWFRG